MNMHTLTIDQLYAELARARKAGMGAKKIMISSDDEGNEYHELFFGITDNVEDVFSGQYGPFLPYGVTPENLKDYVILG